MGGGEAFYLATIPKNQNLSSETDPDLSGLFWKGKPISQQKLIGLIQIFGIILEVEIRWWKAE